MANSDAAHLSFRQLLHLADKVTNCSTAVLNLSVPWQLPLRIHDADLTLLRSPIDSQIEMEPRCHNATDRSTAVANGSSARGHPDNALITCSPMFDLPLPPGGRWATISKGNPSQRAGRIVSHLF